jgi:hypothetical protein
MSEPDLRWQQQFQNLKKSFEVASGSYRNMPSEEA